MVLNFNEFTEKLRKEVENFISENYDGVAVKDITVAKVNGKKRGFELKRSFGKGRGESVIFYNDVLYEGYKEAGSFNSFFEKLKKAMEKNLSEDKISIVEKIDRNYILREVYPMLISTEKNESMLKENGLLHRETDLGLSIVYCFDVKINGADGMVRITSSLAKEYDITEDELYRVALANLSETPPDILQKSHQNTTIIEDGKAGAAHLLNDDILQLVASGYDDNFFIFPISVNTVLAVPAGTNPDILAFELKAAVREINSSEGMPREMFLSDKLLEYNRGSYRLQLA